MSQTITHSVGFSPSGSGLSRPTAQVISTKLVEVAESTYLLFTAGSDLPTRLPWTKVHLPKGSQNTGLIGVLEQGTELALFPDPAYLTAQVIRGSCWADHRRWVRVHPGCLLCSARTATSAGTQSGHAEDLA